MTFHARAGNPDDYPLFVRLVRELHIEDPVPSAEQWEARMLPQLIVLETRNLPVGYAHWLLFGSTAHVVNVVVDPAVRGRGAGLALLEAVRGRVLPMGCTRWSLNVKQDNVAAIRLYERCGFSVDHESWAMSTAWSRLVLPGGAPDDVDLFQPTVDDDASLAASLGLDPARLAMLRSRPELHRVALRVDGVAAGFAAFDPGFPGVHPLRVARVELARPLFEAVRLHAKEDRLIVVVEGDRALHAALEAGGAGLLHALFRMTGRLA